MMNETVRVEEQNESYKVIKIAHDQLEDIIASHLIAIGVLEDNDDIVFIDLGLEVDDEGLVEVDLFFDNENNEAWDFQGATEQMTLQ